MNDLPLQLLDEVKLSELRIVSDFPEYRELMQRAVTLLLLYNGKDFYVDGMPLFEVLEKSNAVDSPTLDAVLKSMSQALKSDLEEDGEELESVDISCTLNGRDRVITIDIVKVNNEVISGGVIL